MHIYQNISMNIKDFDSFCVTAKIENICFSYRSNIKMIIYNNFELFVGNLQTAWYDDGKTQDCIVIAMLKPLGSHLSVCSTLYIDWHDCLPNSYRFHVYFGPVIVSWWKVWEASSPIKPLPPKCGVLNEKQMWQQCLPVK